MRSFIKPLLFSLLAVNGVTVLAAPGEKYPQTKKHILSTKEVVNLSSAERRYAINEIYARHGLLFGDMTLRKQFLKYDWYKPIPGLTMGQAKIRFTRIERQNVERLGLARELEQASVKADDYSAPSAASYVSPYAGTNKAYTNEHFPETRLVKLNLDDVRFMTSAQKRYARNEIYARQGYVFQDMTLRKQFLGMRWYSPKPKLSMAKAAQAMTSLERANLAILSK